MSKTFCLFHYKRMYEMHRQEILHYCFENASCLAVMLIQRLQYFESLNQNRSAILTLLQLQLWLAYSQSLRAKTNISRWRCSVAAYIFFSLSLHVLFKVIDVLKLVLFKKINKYIALQYTNCFHCSLLKVPDMYIHSFYWKLLSLQCNGNSFARVILGYDTAASCMQCSHLDNENCERVMQIGLQ